MVKKINMTAPDEMSYKKKISNSIWYFSDIMGLKKRVHFCDVLKISFVVNHINAPFLNALVNNLRTVI